MLLNINKCNVRAVRMVSRQRWRTHVLHAAAVSRQPPHRYTDTPLDTRSWGHRYTDTPLDTRPWRGRGVSKVWGVCGGDIEWCHDSTLDLRPTPLTLSNTNTNTQYKSPSGPPPSYVTPNCTLHGQPANANRQHASLLRWGIRDM